MSPLHYGRCIIYNSKQRLCPSLRIIAVQMIVNERLKTCFVLRLHPLQLCNNATYSIATCNSNYRYRYYLLVCSGLYSYTWQHVFSTVGDHVAWLVGLVAFGTVYHVPSYQLQVQRSLCSTNTSELTCFPSSSFLFAVLYIVCTVV